MDIFGCADQLTRVLQVTVLVILQRILFMKSDGLQYFWVRTPSRENPRQQHNVKTTGNVGVTIFIHLPSSFIPRELFLIDVNVEKRDGYVRDLSDNLTGPEKINLGR